MLIRTQAPETFEIENVSIPEPLVQRLDNGCPVYVIENHQSPVLSIELLIDTGELEKGKDLVRRFAVQLAAQGTKNFSALQINEKFSYHGTFYEDTVMSRKVQFGIHSHKRHIADVLPLLHEILTEAVFPEQEFQNRAQNYLQTLELNKLKTSVRASQAFDAALYPGTNKGYSFTEDDVKALTRETVAEYFNNNISDKLSAIYIAGSYSKEVFESLNQVFGQYKKTEIQSDEFKGIEPTGLMIEEMPESSQSTVMIGRISINREHPDFTKASVYNTILGGYFGSRLMSNIREDKGLTYGISSRLISGVYGPGTFVISADVNKDLTSLAIQEIKVELQKLCDEDVDAYELDTVKNYLLGNMLGAFSNANEIMQRLKTMHLSGLDLKYYHHYIKTIKNIQPDEIKMLANRYFHPENMFTVVAGSII